MSLGIFFAGKWKHLELNSGDSFHNFVNMLKTTELYSLKGWIWWYKYNNSIIKQKK